jgi:hypothetical protein
LFLQNWFLIQEKEKLPNFVCLIKRLPFTNEADNKMKPYEAEKKQEPINICFGKNKPQKLLIHDLRCGNKQNQDEKPIHHASSRYTKVWRKKNSSHTDNVRTRCFFFEMPSEYTLKIKMMN